MKLPSFRILMGLYSGISAWAKPLSSAIGCRSDQIKGDRALSGSVWGIGKQLWVEAGRTILKQIFFLEIPYLASSNTVGMNSLL